MNKKATMIASSRRRFVVFLDTSLLLILILLLSPRLTGLMLHEILGFVFFIPIIIHLLIAWNWIQHITTRFFQFTTLRTKINYALNCILFVLVITELVSGAIISQVVLPALGIHTINDSTWRSVHNVPLNLLVIVAGLHIAINWSWIVSAFRKKFRVIRKTEMRFRVPMMTIIFRIIIFIAATGVVAIILYSIFGEPSIQRLHKGNEVARFAPTFVHGSIQFLGEAFLIAVYAFVARKWLRVRL